MDVHSLWPVDQNMINVGLKVTTTGFAQPPTIAVHVYSDEPENGSTNAANIAPDTLELRADRDGGGDGRVYLIVVSATNQAGNFTTYSSCTVVVPHDDSRSAKLAVAAQAAQAVAVGNSGGIPAGFVEIGVP